MDDTICYLNTDLELSSPNDLTPLAAALESQGFWALHCDCGGDSLWRAAFEIRPLPCGDDPAHEPETTIAAMLGIIESLAEPPWGIWNSCTLREFNLGYDCGSKPWAFNQGLSSELLGRIAAVGASLRITLYPPEKPCP